ncbi:MAG: CotH kinase family protein [Fibromonadaceae bacterium]|jgi:hypothetical protein|nr:CotH kinase family protein [Fibromonadaceae bacterium]
MKKGIVKTIMAIVLIAVGGVWANDTPVESEKLMILQANTHGNNNNEATGSGFPRSAVELFNNSEQTIDLGAQGYYLHIGRTSRWFYSIKLEGKIPAKSSFLIAGNIMNATPRAALPAADIYYDFEIPNDSFTIALMRTPTLAPLSEGNIWNADELPDFYGDMLGIGNTAGFETAVAANQSRPRIPRRSSLIDTDNNSADFTDIDTRSGVLQETRQRPSNEVLYRFWPRNSGMGAWDPMSGYPRFDPVPSPHLKEPDDPILAGDPDELAGELLIWQAYGSSNDAAGTSHSFVELYNSTDKAINLSGITLFYADGARGQGITQDGDWKAIPLSGTMPAKTSFLILGTRENTTGRLQIPNNFGDINDPTFTLGNRSFKVALIRSAGTLTVQNPFTMDNSEGKTAEGYIDMVGSANDLTHASNPDNIFGFETTPARNSASEAVRRKSLDDTDNNADDFESIRYALNNGISDEDLERFKPKNVDFGPWDPITGKQYVPGDDGIVAQAITSFKFSNQSIGWEENGYWEGIIDSEAKTITFTTQKYIENINRLAAIFELDENGAAFVGTVPQWTGITQNDFRKEIVYDLGEGVKYTVRLVSPQATNLPVMRIDADGTIYHSSAEIWTTMTFSLSDPNNSANDISTISNQQIRGRGNTTWTRPKKPYRIRFRNDVSLFGQAARRNWILLAEFLDPTFLTTPTAFELGKNALDYQPFTCTFQHVHVYLDGQYNGLYVLTEHRQADPNEEGVPGRAKVEQNNGGWFAELDSEWKDDPKFRTASYNLPIQIKTDIFGIDSNDPRYDFVKNDWKELTDLVASESFPENGYRDLIDMNTFVDFLMANEIVWNTELSWPKSVFAYKENKDGKISMGPLWDFDWAFAFAGTGHAYFGYSSGRPSRHSFFNRFFEDPVFLAKYKERWNEKFDEIVAVSSFIETLGETIRVGVSEDTKRWNVPDGYHSGYDANHARQVGNMVNWWNNRAAWLDAEFNKVNVLPASRDFGAETWNDYSDIASQIFTFVAYGEMTDLTAVFQKGDETAFEITIGLDTKASETGNGYFATISVRPKNSLSVGTYTDVLVLSGKNQGKDFSINVPLTFVVGKAAGTWVAVEAIAATYTAELTLSDLTLPNGYAWVAPATALNAGDNQQFDATFTKDANHENATGKVTVNVAKAAGTWVAVEAIAETYFPELTLSDLTLPTGYTWADGTISLNAGDNQQFDAVLTGDANHENAEGKITVNIAKAAGTWVAVEAIAETYTAELTLSGLTLPNGYAWVAPATALNAGDNQQFDAILAGDANHENAEGKITVNIAKATGTTAPDYAQPTILSAKSDETLADVELPEGWKWDADPTTPVGEIGENPHKATFTPANANYSTVASADWTITVDEATSINSGVGSKGSPEARQLASSVQTRYYTLKGTALGTTKPTAPGVYLEKRGKHVRKITIH